ncbi:MULTISPECIES: tripartite tricarboxylate transporter substrate binding protein [unclassified Achromobacter]|uniref:Bug family tripartite tricarboxylate transporter substrate binding protein n=1 Tax=unclassified Achromobacter TaxID=2626865 RepID=UPI0013033ABE|nr:MULTISPECIES: tripartite tricarboxylate transporter substrate-binding protein [unclassified Achromobacter]
MRYALSAVRSGRLPQKFLAMLGITATLLAGPGAARADEASAWPTRPITLVAPFAPGGSTDILARVVAAGMSKVLKQSVVVENRAGAGGTIGAAVVARARPDGYTILLSNVTLGSADSLYKNLSYDFIKDFDHVAYLGAVPCVLVASKSLPVTSAPEFFSYLRAHAGQLNFGSSGIGAASHLCTQSFLSTGGFKANHVPYRGAGPMMVDIMSGRIAFALDTAPNASSHIQGGKVLGLAVAADQRIPLLPDLPTIKEAGVPFEMSIWYGLATPRNTPKEIDHKIYEAAQVALRDPEVLNAYRSLGASVTAETQQAFLARVEADKVRWTGIVKQAEIEPQ